MVVQTCVIVTRALLNICHLKKKKAYMISVAVGGTPELYWCLNRSLTLIGNLISDWCLFGPAGGQVHNK